MTQSIYPGSYDTFVDYEAKKDKAKAEYLNKTQDAIYAIQHELGTDPAGSASTLTARLTRCIEDNGSFKHGTSFPGSPNQGDWFFRTDENIAYVYTGSSWLSQSGNTSYSAGNILICGPSDFSLDSSSLGSYTKVQEIVVPRSGTLRIKFWLCEPDAQINAYGKIYRNGSAVGTQQTSNSATASQSSEDISGWAAGDLLQLYVKTDHSKVAWGGLEVYESSPPREYFNTGGTGNKSTPKIWSIVSGDPNTNFSTVGNIGDLCLRQNGGASTTLYVKTGASTWTAK